MHDKVKLPPGLVEAFNQGQVALFIGHGLFVQPGGLPSLPSIAGELANQTEAWPDCLLCKGKTQCGYPDGCQVPFERIATLYESKHGRESLISFVREKLGTHKEPLSIHDRLVDLPVQVIVTTSYDELIVKACCYEPNRLEA